MKTVLLVFTLCAIASARPLLTTLSNLGETQLSSPLYQMLLRGEPEHDTILQTTSIPATLPRPETLHDSGKFRQPSMKTLPPRFSYNIPYRSKVNSKVPPHIRLINVSPRVIDSDLMIASGQRAGRRQPPPRSRRSKVKQNTTNPSSARRHHRQKRYMYEDLYDWDYEAMELDYELDEKSDIEKFLDDWHTEGIKLVGILCVFMCCFCTVCCVCRTAVRSIVNGCKANCQACGDRLRCRDPSYRKFCKAAGPFGLKMSYKDYKKLKGHYTEYAMNKYGNEAPKI